MSTGRYFQLVIGKSKSWDPDRDILKDHGGIAMPPTRVDRWQGLIKIGWYLCMLMLHAFTYNIVYGVYSIKKYVLL